MNETELVVWTRKMLRDGIAKKLRLAAGLSLYEAGDAIGVEHTTILTWEDGSSRGRPALLAAYGRFLLRLARLLKVLDVLEKVPRA